jgi:hypothetical protein
VVAEVGTGRRDWLGAIPPHNRWFLQDSEVEAGAAEVAVAEDAVEVPVEVPAATASDDRALEEEAPAAFPVDAAAVGVAELPAGADSAVVVAVVAEVE